MNRPTLSGSMSWVKAVTKKNILKKNLNWLKRTKGMKVMMLYLVFFTILF